MQDYLVTCINEMHENLGVESRESLRRDSSTHSSNQNPNNWDSTGTSSSWEGSTRKSESSESSSSKVSGSGEQERENASGLKSSTPTEMFGVVDYIYST